MGCAVLIHGLRVSGTRILPRLLRVTSGATPYITEIGLTGRNVAFGSFHLFLRVCVSSRKREESSAGGAKRRKSAGGFSQRVFCLFARSAVFPVWYVATLYGRFLFFFFVFVFFSFWTEPTGPRFGARTGRDLRLPYQAWRERLGGESC